MSNLYKDYYKAKHCGDDWTASNIAEKISDLEETASLNNCSLESLMEDGNWKFSGGL